MGVEGDGGLPVFGGGDVEFGAAAEGDHADALAAGELFAGGDGGDDAAGDGADDLFEDGGGGGVLGCAGRGEGDGVGLVFVGALGVAGVEEEAFLVAAPEDGGIAGGAVDVDIQD